VTLSAKQGWYVPAGLLIALVLLRIAIGWHFLYEGLTKVEKGGWSSKGYLVNATGPLADHFKGMVVDPATGEERTQLIAVMDALVIAGLIGCGASLILGLFTRAGCLAGMAMLTMFYLSSPPLEAFQPPYAKTAPDGSTVFVAKPKPAQVEGNYMIVNKNMVEFLALAVLLFAGTGHWAGLDWLVRRIITGRAPGEAAAPAPTAPPPGQRALPAA
jgi:thiosulfate dehydrogenase [quinone] large subunit